MNLSRLPASIGMGFRLLWLATLVIGLAVLLTPEAAKKPLIPNDGWSQEAGQFFANSPPISAPMSREIIQDPASRFWSSWNPAAPVAPSRMATVPFTAPRFLAIPFVGYPRAAGITLSIERFASGERLQVAHGSVHESWTERTLWLSGSWQGQIVRLVAEGMSGSPFYIGCGTPHSSSLISWLKESVFVAVFIHGATFLLLLAPGAALLLAVRRSAYRRIPGSVWIVPISLLFALGAFFLVFYLPRLGPPALFIVESLALGVLFLTRRRLEAIIRRDRLAEPMLLMFCLSLLYVLGLYVADNGLGTTAATYRFEPAVWSSDNQIPEVVAEAVRHKIPLSGLLGHWHVSDRPPLMSGFFLLVRPLFEPLLAIGNNARITYLTYQIPGIVLSTFWVIPVWRLFRRLLTSRRGPLLATLLLGTTGFCIFNSTYIWPKLLAGALGLMACEVAGLWSSPPPVRRWLDAVGTGTLAGLSMMAHGGTIFGLGACGLVALHPKRRPPLIWIALAAIAFVATMVPWSLWQRIEDPPGNALTKYAFTGDYGFGGENIGVWQTVHSFYESVTPAAWFKSRASAIRTLFGAETPQGVSWLELSPAFHGPGRLRVYEFLFPIAALGIANLGWFGVARGAFTRGDRGRARQLRTLCLNIAVLSILLNVFMTWTPQIVHTQSYMAILLLLVALYAEILSWPRLASRAAVLLHAIYFLVVWVISPMAMFPIRVDYLIGCVLMTILFGAFFAASVEHDFGREARV